MSNPLKEALERFTGRLPEEAAAELDTADKATAALDAAGVERKAVDEALVDETAAEGAAVEAIEAGQATNGEPAATTEDAVTGQENGGDEAAQLTAAMEARMTEIAAAQAAAAVAELASEKALQAAVQQAVTEQVKTMLTQEDGPLQKGLSDAVQWRLTDLLPGVAAAAVSEEIWRQLDQGGPLKDAMDGLAAQVTTVLSNLDSMANKQQELDTAQKSIGDRLDGLAMAPRSMQDAVRRAVWSKSTAVDTPANQPEQFTPAEDEASYLGPIKVDPIPVTPPQQAASPAPAQQENTFLGPIKVEPI